MSSTVSVGRRHPRRGLFVLQSKQHANTLGRSRGLLRRAHIMARFERSLKTPMGERESVRAPRTMSPFASTVVQRGAMRPVTGRAGPGFYERMHFPVNLNSGFALYEDYRADRRQPFHKTPPMSATLRKPNTRYVSTTPQLTGREHWNTPGPGAYNLEHFSAFRTWPGVSRGQPYAVSRAARSSIRDVFGDARCGVFCKPERTPPPNAYAPVPALDRLRMSMRDSPTSGRMTPQPGRPLSALLQSSANLSSTLKSLR